MIGPFIPQTLEQYIALDNFIDYWVVAHSINTDPYYIGAAIWRCTSDALTEDYRAYKELLDTLRPEPDSTEGLVVNPGDSFSIPSVVNPM